MQSPSLADFVQASQGRYPFQEVNGEYSPNRVLMYFSLGDLKQIKQEVGKFSGDPDKYIEVTRGLTKTYELDWKDVVTLKSNVDF